MRSRSTSDAQDANADGWRQPTFDNLRVRRLWPWAFSIQKFVDLREPRPRGSPDVLIASDFGGEHAGATHNVYCYLAVRDGGRHWSSAMRDVRRKLLLNGRTMSYKRLDDRQRQAALIPFLEAAADLDGHLVAIAVDKRQKALSTDLGDLDEIHAMLGLTARWRTHALEVMLRKVLFPALLLPLWSVERTNVTWITDRDEFVQNDGRHDDALATFARMMGYFLRYPMGDIRLHTTGQDSGRYRFEDLCSIPDLAAGMLSDVLAAMSRDGRSDDNHNRLVNTHLQVKAEVLAEWFWDQSTRLRKTAIVIDVVDAERSIVRLLSMKTVDDADEGFPR